jgi:hypothetical protein
MEVERWRREAGRGPARGAAARCPQTRVCCR